ncbi:MAG: hypothetical protein V1895_03235 [Parcubacteria group bacterium]
MPSLSPKTLVLERQVLELRTRDMHCSHKQIASRLGEPLWRIHYVTSRLISAGKLTRRTRCWGADHSRQTADIVALRSSNLPNKAIAAAVGITLATLYLRLRTLLKTGEVARRMPGRIGTPATRMLSFWKDPTCPRFVWLVGQLQRRVPLEIIGRELGCSTQRVCQIKAAMIELFGPDLFETQLLTIRQAGKHAGLSVEKVYALCQAGRITVQQRRRGSPLLVSKDQIEVFRSPQAQEQESARQASV